jgi:hypothetical protein
MKQRSREEEALLRDLNPIEASRYERDKELVKGLWKYNDFNEHLPKDAPDGEHNRYVSIHDMRGKAIIKHKQLFERAVSYRKYHWQHGVKRLNAQRSDFLSEVRKEKRDYQKLSHMANSIVDGAEQFVHELKNDIRYDDKDGHGLSVDISGNPYSEHFEGGLIVHCLVEAQSVACETKLEATKLRLFKMRFGRVVQEFRNILNIFIPSRTHYYVPRALEIDTILRIAQVMDKLGLPIIAMRFFRACAAASRLRLQMKKLICKELNCKESTIKGSEAKKMVCEKLIYQKRGRPRPFLSCKRVDSIKQELQMGTHAPESGVCECCHKNERQVMLLRCSSCRTVWYCSKECQQKHWKSHRQTCGSEWRKVTIKVPFQAYRILIRKFEKIRLFYADDRVCPMPLVILRDKKTGEFFDGLSDRTIVVDKRTIPRPTELPEENKCDGKIERRHPINEVKEDDGDGQEEEVEGSTVELPKSTALLPDEKLCDADIERIHMIDQEVEESFVELPIAPVQSVPLSDEKLCDTDVEGILAIDQEVEVSTQMR